MCRRKLVRKIWERVAIGGVLVLIEPGTPIGYSIVEDARAELLGLVDALEPTHLASVVAPVK